MAKKIKIDIGELDQWIWYYASALDLDSKCDLIYKYHNSDSNEITVALYELPFNEDTITNSYYITIPLVDGKLMDVDTWLKKYKNYESYNIVLEQIQETDNDIAEITDKIRYHKESKEFCEERLQMVIRQREEQVAKYKEITGDDYDALMLDHGDE